MAIRGRCPLGRPRPGAHRSYDFGGSLPTLFYIVEKHADRGRARTGVERCLQHLTVVPVDRSIAEVALQGPSADFEDNLQLACAVRAGAEALIARDPKGFAGSPIPVLSPTEFLTKIVTETPDAP